MREVNTSIVNTYEYFDLLNFKKEIKKNSILVNDICNGDHYQFISKDKAFLDIKKRLEAKDAEIQKLKDKIEDCRNTIKQLSESELNTQLKEYAGENGKLTARTDALLNFIRDLLLTSRWSLNKFRNQLRNNPYIMELLIESNKHEGIYKIY